MRRLIVVIAMSLCAAAGNGGSVSSGAAVIATVLSPGWGKAEPVPGLAALTAPGGDSALNSVSCASAGNCGAGGYYQGGAGNQCCTYLAFVVSEQHGTWGNAEPVPGLAALDTARNSRVTSVSCASPGNCTAGGTYVSRQPRGARPVSVFVVTEVHGRWGQARQLPGFGAVNLGEADLSSVSCAAPGNCVAGGYDSPHPTDGGCCQREGFVASQVNGVWSKPHQVPGTQEIDSVSCPAPGDCAAAGRLVLSETNGRWTKPILVRGSGGQARLTSISCAAPGNCDAVGYLDAKVKGHLRAVAAAAASLLHGTWSRPPGARPRQAQQVPL